MFACTVAYTGQVTFYKLTWPCLSGHPVGALKLRDSTKYLVREIYLKSAKFFEISGGVANFHFVIR